MKEINFKWKHSSKRKVHQRAVNRVIRAINENIENDELWRGRFFVRQYESCVVRYEDGSGNQLFIQLRFYDHKTRKYWDMWISSNKAIIWGGSHIWRAMNDFIVEKLDVWTNDDPRADKTDYRKFSRDETIKYSDPVDWGWSYDIH